MEGQQIEEVATQYVQQIQALEPEVKTEYVEVEKIVEKIVEVPGPEVVIKQDTTEMEQLVALMAEDLTILMSQSDSAREQQMLHQSRLESLTDALVKRDALVSELKTELESIKVELKSLVAEVNKPKVSKETIQLQKEVNNLLDSLGKTKAIALDNQQRIKKTSIYGIILGAAVLSLLLLL